MSLGLASSSPAADGLPTGCNATDKSGSSFVTPVPTSYIELVIVKHRGVRIAAFAGGWAALTRIARPTTAAATTAIKPVKAKGSM